MAKSESIWVLRRPVSLVSINVLFRFLLRFCFHRAITQEGIFLCLLDGSFSIRAIRDCFPALVRRSLATSWDWEQLGFGDFQPELQYSAGELPSRAGGRAASGSGCTHLRP